MTVIALDIGNTRIGAGLFRQAKGIEPAKRIEQSDWQQALPALLKSLMEEAAEDIDGVVVASVVPQLTAPISQIVRSVTGKDVKIAGTDLSIPLKTALTDDRTVGVDRLLGALSAYVNTEQACVIVSAGTALVVDCVDDAGLFLGGTIAPGLTLGAKALHEWTSQLPQASLDIPNGIIGRNTMDAVNCGLYAMARGGVREIIERCADQLGNWPHVVATGGDAQRLFAESGLIDSFIPDLVLQGAALVWEHHNPEDGPE